MQTEVSIGNLPHPLSKARTSSWKPPPLLSKSSRSSFTTRSNRQLTTDLSQLTNEKLPTDFDRVATGKQPFMLGTVASSRAFRLGTPYHDVYSTMVALFGVLVKR